MLRPTPAPGLRSSERSWLGVDVGRAVPFGKTTIPDEESAENGGRIEPVAI